MPKLDSEIIKYLTNPLFTLKVVFPAVEFNIFILAETKKNILPGNKDVLHILDKFCNWD